MIRICGWCQKYLGKVDDKDDALISHGICEKCARKVLENLEKIEKDPFLCGDLTREEKID